MKKIMIILFLLALTMPLYSFAQDVDDKADKSSISASTNPRGQARPSDGRGRGSGMRGGKRRGQNQNPCPNGGPGYGGGQGRGQGKNRK
jgi:hypothetical protein